MGFERSTDLVVYENRRKKMGFRQSTDLPYQTKTEKVISAP